MLVGTEGCGRWGTELPVPRRSLADPAVPSAQEKPAPTVTENPYGDITEVLLVTVEARAEAGPASVSSWVGQRNAVCPCPGTGCQP